jgi:hypothetical protein
VVAASGEFSVLRLALCLIPLLACLLACRKRSVGRVKGQGQVSTGTYGISAEQSDSEFGVSLLAP